MLARDKQPKVQIRNLFKIFGPEPQSVLDKAKSGLGKSEMLNEYNHVLGLRNINVDIHEGDITVIMGLSGSGKSTLIRHLNRLIEPTDGEILLDGKDVTKLSRSDLRNLRRRSMSMVFQKFALLPHRTILENAGMALRVRGEKKALIEEQGRLWLDRVGLKGYEDYYPPQLSGGMQQRVGLARALASDSPIMLMDEAFSALDPLIRTDMQNLLLELQTDLHKTIIFITHDLDEALKLADHLVILKDGAVIQQGEPQNILLHPNDPYIEDFVADINRARVLRVRSVMEPISGDGTAEQIDRAQAGHDTVDYNATLEDVIAKAGGESSKSYVVVRNDRPVGTLHMKDLFRALVPRISSSDRDGEVIASEAPAEPVG